MAETQVTRWATGPPPTEDELAARMTADGLQPRTWENAPGDRYEWHEHPYTKILYCISGSIVFHTDAGDVDLRPGDRLELPPGTRHAATVGLLGVRCIEAPARE